MTNHEAQEKIYNINQLIDTITPENASDTIRVLRGRLVAYKKSPDYSDDRKSDLNSLNKIIFSIVKSKSNPTTEQLQQLKEKYFNLFEESTIDSAKSDKDNVGRSNVPSENQNSAPVPSTEDEAAESKDCESEDQESIVVHQEITSGADNHTSNAESDFVPPVLPDNVQELLGYGSTEMTEKQRQALQAFSRLRSREALLQKQMTELATNKDSAEYQERVKKSKEAIRALHQQITEALPKSIGDEEGVADGEDLKKKNFLSQEGYPVYNPTLLDTVNGISPTEEELPYTPPPPLSISSTEVPQSKEYPHPDTDTMHLMAEGTSEPLPTAGNEQFEGIKELIEEIRYYQQRVEYFLQRDSELAKSSEYKSFQEYLEKIKKLVGDGITTKNAGIIQTLVKNMVPHARSIERKYQLLGKDAPRSGTAFGAKAFLKGLELKEGRVPALHEDPEKHTLYKELKYILNTVSDDTGLTPEEERRVLILIKKIGLPENPLKLDIGKTIDEMYNRDNEKVQRILENKLPALKHLNKKRGFFGKFVRRTVLAALVAAIPSAPNKDEAPNLAEAMVNGPIAQAGHSSFGVDENAPTVTTDAPGHSLRHRDYVSAPPAQGQKPDVEISSRSERSMPTGPEVEETVADFVTPEPPPETTADMSSFRNIDNQLDSTEKTMSDIPQSSSQEESFTYSDPQLESYIVQKNDNLIKFIEGKLDGRQMLPALQEVPETYRAHVLRHVIMALRYNQELQKTVGVTSGNVDLIYTGQELNPAALNDLIAKIHEVERNHFQKK